MEVGVGVGVGWGGGGGGVRVVAFHSSDLTFIVLRLRRSIQSWKTLL